MKPFSNRNAAALPHDRRPLRTKAQRRRVRSVGFLILGAMACVWLYARSREVPVSAAATGAREREDVPAAAARRRALKPPFALGKDAAAAAPGDRIVERTESGMVVMTRTHVPSGQAGAPAMVSAATSSDPSSGTPSPSEPSPSAPRPGHDALEAQWAAEPRDMDSSGDGRESAAIEELGLDAKMVLSTECRASVCRVEVVIPWADPDPDMQPDGRTRPPDNPDPDRDITALFYPRVPHSTERVATEPHLQVPR